MRKHWFLGLVLPLVGVLALASACSDDADSSADTSVPATSIDLGDTTETTAFAEPSTSTTYPGDYPCILFEPADLTAILGNELDAGDGVTNNVSETDPEGTEVTYSGEECIWFSDSGEGNGLTVQVSEADDFPSGSVECPPAPGEVTPVTGIGNSATYEVAAATTLEVGTLRVCSDAAFVVVRVDGPVGEDHQQMAVDIAALTLDAVA